MSEYIHLADVERGSIEDPEEAVALTIVFNSMQIVHSGMRTKGLGYAEVSDTKADGTLVTAYDKASERMGALICGHLAPHLNFQSEEGTHLTGTGSRTIRIDPLDGTRNFAVGGGDATVIAAVYNPDNTVYGAAIGHPATGRVFSAFGDRPTEGRLLEVDASGLARTVRHNRSVTTWRGHLEDNGQVFVDSSQPFTRSGHTTLTTQQHTDLRRSLIEQSAGVLELGSNGAHQLAVASGADRAMAAITTARGIWEDTSAGIYLIERAGGCAQRFSSFDGHIRAVGANHLDYDLAIATNNRGNLHLLTEMLLSLSA